MCDFQRIWLNNIDGVMFRKSGNQKWVFPIRDSINWHEESNTYTADFFWPS